MSVMVGIQSGINCLEPILVSTISSEHEVSLFSHLLLLKTAFTSCLSKTLIQVYLQTLHLGTITVNWYGPTYRIFVLTICSIYYILCTVNYIL